MIADLENLLIAALRTNKGQADQLEARRRLCASAANVIDGFLADPDNDERLRDLMRLVATLRRAGERKGSDQ